MNEVELTSEQQKKLNNNRCREYCNDIPEIGTEYTDKSFQEIGYYAECGCQKTRLCLEIDTAIDEWIRMNNL